MDETILLFLLWFVVVVERLFVAEQPLGCVVADVSGDFVGFVAYPTYCPLGHLQSKTLVLDMEWHSQQKHRTLVVDPP